MKAKLLPWACKCSSCIETITKIINKRIRQYNLFCQCWCKHWHHLTTNNPNFTAWQCMDCHDCSWFLIRK